MSEESLEKSRNSCVLPVYQNSKGILFLCGEAVQNGVINEYNINDIFERMLPYLDDVEDMLTEDRALPIYEKDLDILNGPKAYVYVPEGIEVNYGDNSAPPPTTEYEKDRWTFDRGAIITITGENNG
jgi:hypothetical protein